jgi:hypothetical protein
MALANTLDEEDSMNLKLSEMEAAALKRALDTYRAQLDYELSRTDVRELQHALHQDSDRLNEIDARLSALIPKPLTAQG